MAGITFPRDQIFRGWTEHETSRIVDGDFGSYEVQKIQKMIARHHTSETQEPYFYSVRTICPADIAIEAYRTKKRQQLALIIIASLGVSVLVYLATRSYFENAWKVCQAIADKTEYVVKNIYWDRPATALDICRMHPTARAWELIVIRIAFCVLFPIVVGYHAGDYYKWAVHDKEVNERRYYNLILDRTKDERVPPSNFDIQNEVDPFTQEKISLQKLHSPEMIYLPNYVTEAKSFVTALLTAGKTDFLDPFYLRKFTVEEHKNIISQIERIFLISEAKFNECFERGNEEELRLDQVNPHRYLFDERIFGVEHLSLEATQKLHEVFGDQLQAMSAEIDAYAVQIPNLLQRDFLIRFAWLNTLNAVGFVKNLREDDKASSRIHFFEEATGVTLRAAPVK